MPGQLRSSEDAAGDVDELLDRLIADGYLFLPGYLDAERLIALRSLVVRTLVGVGWLAPGDGICPATPGTAFTRDSFSSVYAAVQALEEVHEAGHDPRLWRLMSGLLGGDVFCLPAKAVRLSAPAPARRASTRAHQDFAAQQVTTDTLTAWIALTPCDSNREGLRVMARSHLDGFRPTDPTVSGARPLYLDLADDDPRWLTADYRVGDLVVFHSLTVHGGGPNTSDELRLSLDCRYQLTTDPLREEFAHPHGWPRTPDWPELSRHWRDTRWVRVPRTAEIIPMPSGVTFQEYLDTLTAPPSRLIAAGTEEGNNL